MFFVIGKLVWFFVKPLHLLAVLLGLGWLFNGFSIRPSGRAVRGSMLHRLSRFCFICASLLLVLMILPHPAYLVVQMLENRFQRPALNTLEPKGIIILGGWMENGMIMAGREVVSLNASADRFVSALELARKRPQLKIIYASGSVNPDDMATPSEAAMTETLLANLYLLDNRVTIESTSRTTWENATEVAKLLQNSPDDLWLLVTSAWHMPRAIGSFRAAGLEVLPWPTDYQTAGTSLPPWGSMRNGIHYLELAMHEILGLIAYRLSGRSTAFLPGPVS